MTNQPNSLPDRCEFTITGLDEDLFEVAAYRGTEGLSQLGRFEIDLVADGAGPSIDAVTGKPACLKIRTPQGMRWFHGMISSLETVDHAWGRTRYQAELVPTLWTLTCRYQSRIFQDKTVLQIVTEVLDSAGIPTDYALTAGVQNAKRPLKYCVQYRETDYNFLCRILEAHGIWWYFQQDETGHRWVLADSTAAYRPIAGQGNEVRYIPPSGMNAPEEHVYGFHLGKSVRPNAATLVDFNFESPALDLRADEPRGANGAQDQLFMRDYPGGHSTQADGAARANLQREVLLAASVRGVGESNCHRLSPGKTYRLTEHPNKDHNNEYLLTRIAHEGQVRSTWPAGRRCKPQDSCPTTMAWQAAIATSTR
ncbi:MAG: type VI secretion system Vgr family protein [Planctomycetota bacterium]|jgi:type VI secretion system secreted protein VgrG